ncbi:MAG TPA: Nramp family divalent metal transporter [Vicinamibacterales bacterium]|nr:Nramp family divalent metal transporter [Vicinamibacterales bacterium]
MSTETRSGLPAWKPADLPNPPVPRGLQWIGVVGPGVIVLGLSIGSGEFLLGPAVFVRHGLTLLWVTAVSVFLQTIFNTELMRYTLATGEPVFTGFMRTPPSSTFWAWIYSVLYFLQAGWPAWAANAAGAVYFLFARRLAGPDDATVVYLIGIATFLASTAVLFIGRRIERTLELFNWALIVGILSSFLVLALVFVPGSIWGSAAGGLIGFDTAEGRFNFLPAGVDWVLLAALVAYSGAGGMANVTLSNWARDRGYGMGERVGYIPAAVGGKKVNLAHSGFIFQPTPDNIRRWHGWWRIVRADQWGVFFAGGLLGMVLPALLYVTFLPRGTDIRGLGIAAALASSIGAQAGPLLAGVIAFLGVWILFKTQLDQMEAMVRALTDMLWTGSARIRAWRGGDVRKIYYAVLLTLVIWGIIALRLAQPIVLLQIGANVASVVFVITSLHLLYINTRLLPRQLRPPGWRRAMLVFMALFYGFFSALSVSTLF